MPEAPDVLGLNPRAQGWQVVITTLSDSYKENTSCLFPTLDSRKVKHQSSARGYWFSTGHEILMFHRETTS